MTPRIRVNSLSVGREPRHAEGDENVCRRKATIIASSSIDSTVDFRSFGPVGRSATTAPLGYCLRIDPIAFEERAPFGSLTEDLARMYAREPSLACQRDPVASNMTRPKSVCRRALPLTFCSERSISGHRRHPCERELSRQSDRPMKAIGVHPQLVMRAEIEIRCSHGVSEFRSLVGPPSPNESVELTQIAPRPVKLSLIFINRYFHPDHSSTSQIAQELGITLSRLRPRNSRKLACTLWIQP